MLVRNYDYAPSRMEGIIWSTRLAERRVIGMSDCLWGLLDGMNDAGLAVSLTFGGRRVLGDGFGIPLVVRYLLETCDDVASARESLARLPYALAHNLTVVDARGRGADRLPVARPRAVLPQRSGGDEPSGHGGVAGAGARDPHHRTRAVHPRPARTIPRRPRRRSRRRSCVRRSSARPTTAASARSTRPPTGRPRASVDYRWPSFSWRLGFDVFVEGEHTEVAGGGSGRVGRGRRFRMSVHRRWRGWNTPARRKRGHLHGERWITWFFDADDHRHRRRCRARDRLVPELGDRERELRQDRDGARDRPRSDPGRTFERRAP